MPLSPLEIESMETVEAIIVESDFEAERRVDISSVITVLIKQSKSINSWWILSKWVIRYKKFIGAFEVGVVCEGWRIYDFIEGVQLFGHY